MNIFCSLLAAPATIAAVAAPAQRIEVQRFGLYVLASDVERSVAFYEALFGKAPQVRTPALVGFDLAGGLFAIISREAYAPGAAAGGGVRPYIRVADIDAAFAHVRELVPASIESAGVVTEGPFRFFRFSDPDGNMIELFSFAPEK